MDWETLIDSLLDNVKDVDARKEIYSRLLENCDYSEADLLEEVMGVDSVFDTAAQKFLDDLDMSVDDEEEFEEDDDYDELNLEDE